MSEIAAILLAAGQSSRMGAFKPLLPFGEKSVIKTCVDNLRDAGIQDVIIVVGNRDEEVRAHLKNERVRFALNPDLNSEMSASIACGIEQIDAETKAVMLALVDHPAVPPETIAYLIDEWQQGKSKLIQPEHDGRGGHPVLIDLNFLAELRHLDPQRGLRALFDAHRGDVRRIAVESPYVARDMDTWEDYRRLHEDVFGTPPGT